MTTLAHSLAGRGPRGTVLLHGFLGSGRNLGALARGLADAADTLTVLTVDLTGHGASPPLPPRAGTATVAADVLETARVAGLEPPLTLVGHSLGARVALRAALTTPAAVAGLVMLDMSPSPLPAHTEAQRMAEALVDAPATAATREAMREHFVARGFAPGLADWLLMNLVRDGDGFRWCVDRGALAAFGTRFAAEDLWPAIERPRAYTVRCIRGALSDQVGAADVRRLVAAGCPVDTVAGAGHFLHVDRPAEVLALLRRALESRRT